jgi:NADH dehydrogenase/NADH:ubiquinone oxidoreductase subunit G
LVASLAILRLGISISEFLVANLRKSSPVSHLTLRKENRRRRKRIERRKDSAKEMWRREKSEGRIQEKEFLVEAEKEENTGSHVAFPQ